MSPARRSSRPSKAATQLHSGPAGGAALLQEIRHAFSRFGQPKQYVGNNLYEAERLDYEQMLGGKQRGAIEAVDFGSTTWTPLPYLTPEATAYLLPRLIELAESGARDKDGDPFLMRFINYVSVGPSAKQFSLLDRKQRGLVTAYLEFVATDHMPLVIQECWNDVLEEAIRAWRRA